MTTRQILNQWENWLLPGSPSDSRLFHADAADQILVYPAHLGQGYRQKILLRDDLTLIILDYTLAQDVVYHSLDPGDCLKFEFRLDAGYSSFLPQFGLQHLGFNPAHKRAFEVEVIFKLPSLVTYFQSFMERLPCPTQSIAERTLLALYKHRTGGKFSSVTSMLNRICDRTRDAKRSPALAFSSPNNFEHILPDDLYAEAIDLIYTIRHPHTPVINQVIGQILSCPYQGTIRRTYLECKALELVSLHLEAMTQPCLNQADLNSVYQAAAILRKQLINPPTVEILARQVHTNRLKLNRGFHQVYGTTPYGYLKNCRLNQARRLLLTSELSVEKVAATVGYTCRSKFATAFRQQMGLNPKTFQMQAWQLAS
ncbi:MAG: helix-turn-helix transcriptional regulator [Cyanobacteria bacterium P01_F01_bin.86]